MDSCGFEAVAEPNAATLILGTLPGPLSLATGQYYAQPRNAFWTIMADVVGFDPKASYEDRLRSLTRRQIALWDVCKSATRSGALDRNIQLASVRPNDFATFLNKHSGIRSILFNGTRANALFERLVRPGLEHRVTGIRFATMPSSSSANAVPFDQKLQSWRTLLADGLE